MNQEEAKAIISLLAFLVKWAIIVWILFRLETIACAVGALWHEDCDRNDAPHN